MERARKHASGLLVLLILLPVALAGSPTPDDMIHACILAPNEKSQGDQGDLRIVDGPEQCRQNESYLSWNARGPAGADGLNCWDLDADGMADAEEDVNGDGRRDALDCQGPRGPVGPAGADGQDGAPGANGLDCWDLDGDGTADADEDVNGDAQHDALDCGGPRGEAGAPGADGQDGAQGSAGADGLHCWDLDGNGEADLPEDINGDGLHDALDCRGSDGKGPTGAECTPGTFVTGFDDQGQLVCASEVVPTQCDLDDPAEPNDQLSQAPQLAGGQHQICLGNQDWFFFDPSTPRQAVRVDALYSATDGNVDVFVYNTLAELVAQGKSTDNDDRLEFITGEAGRYYVQVIQVSDAGAAGQAYSLNLQFLAPCDDAAEPNDALSTARAFVGGQHRICPGNEDWFFFVPSTPRQAVRVDAMYSASDGNVDVFVYDARSEIIAQGRSTDNDERVEFITGDAGRYYVQVVQLSDAGPVGQTYGLSLQFLAPCDDAAEPNDALSQARLLVGGQQRICPGNEDWFFFDPSTPRQAVRLDALYVSSDGNVDVSVYNARREVIAQGQSTDNDERLEFITGDAGRYYVQVLQSSDAGPVGQAYNLVLQFLAPCDDPAEPNDALSQARLFANAQYRICPGNEDWFFIDQPSPRQAIRVDALYASTDGNVDVFVYNARSEVIAQGESTDNDDRLEFITGDAGRYYIQVVQRSDAGTVGQFYGLNLQVLAPCDDPAEPNDALSQARLFVNAQHRICPGNEDWFFFDQPTPRQAIRLDVLYSATDGNVDVFVYNARAERVAQGQSTDNDERLDFVTGDAGRYYVQVVQLSDAGTVGQLYVLSRQVVGSCDDGGEPNDSRSQARLFVNAQYRICPGNEDWFFFDQTTPRQGIRIDAFYASGDGNIDVFVYNARTDLIAQAQSIDNDERVEFITGDVGRYYVQVVQLSDAGSVGQPYTLNLQALGSCDDTAEPNDAKSTAVSGLVSYGTLRICPGNEDWFTTSLQAGQTIQINLGFAHANGDIDVFLYDGRLTRVATGASVANNEQITYTATASGPVLWQVTLTQDFSTFGNAYGMSVAIS